MKKESSIMADQEFAVEVIGMYRIEPTVSSLVEAAKYHEYDWLLDEVGRYADSIDWEAMVDLALVELLVSGEITEDLVDSVNHGGQAAYMEFYLDASGNRLLAEDDAFDAQSRRICFFLHDADPEVALEVDGEEYVLPVPTRLPERLLPFTHYLPVD